MRAPSFAEAAADYRRAVGGTVSADSARRLTEGFGHATIALRTAEVQKVYDLEQGDIGSIAPIAPIAGQANISTDGTMILVRGEGWKEVKLTVISRCEIIDTEKGRKVKLDEHSCQAGLWDADTMARHQYLEGLRRGLIACEKLSSVNDAAPWIGRITEDNFPHVVLIVDWPHAKQRLFTVAQELFGEGNEAATEWAEAKTDLLWQGDVAAITSALKAFPDDETAYRAQSYFEGHAEQMEYARFRQEGYPVGSGTVESGGKNYVQRRMKRPGPGWNRDTGQAMLSGLSELHSGRFDAVWEQCA